MAVGLPEIDPESYRVFRANMCSLAARVAEHLAPANGMPLIPRVLREIESYRNGWERSRRVEMTRWRTLAAKLVGRVVAASGINATSHGAMQLLEEVERLETSSDVERYSKLVDEFLRGGRSQTESVIYSQRVTTDRSTTNDNPAGLRGGGSAVEHVARIMEQGGRGFIVLFRLGCLEVISDRYGVDAAEDCLMAIAAYLTRNLRREDAIFHWSDSSLLAVLLGRTNEQIMLGEVRRIAAQNRGITIQIGCRAVMLHVPLEFEVTPIGLLRKAEDIYHHSLESAATG